MTIVLVMGVSGSGKSTVGRLLAERMRWRFIDADDYHPAANVERMRSGHPLSDEDRRPWLEQLAALLEGARRERQPVVLACSALKRSYRDTLTGERRDDVLLVHLEGDEPLLRSRMEGRRHFMPPENLRSQLATFEPPSEDEHALALEVRDPPEVLVHRIEEELRRRGWINRVVD